ncbi:MAG: biopolymer transporter ExbD [Candidatus Cybelea sp.]
MGLLSSRQDEEVMAEINITPFTDVLLVLLIIFMILAALVAPPGFEKELANRNPNSANTPNNKNDIQVIVNEKGVIYVDNKKTDTIGVYRMMYEVSKVKPHHHVQVIGDIKAPYGIIIRVLDAAKQAGLEDVGFVTGG